MRLTSQPSVFKRAQARRNVAKNLGLLAASVYELPLPSWMKASSPKATMRGGVPGFNKTEIDLMCPEMAHWETEMQRLVSALAVTATMLCCGSAARAQVVICPPLPPSYPRGWELMVRYPCVTYVYGPSYYSPAYYPYPAYPHQRERVHRRPYLRPGWWW
jgi:hypothetical protein